MEKFVDEGVPGYRLAGGRLREGVRRELADVAYPVPERRIAPVLEAVHDFDKAHVITLTRGKVISASDGSAILRCLLELEVDNDVPASRLSVGGGNHSGEKYISSRLGEEIGGRIHTGRSSGDVSAVANRLTQQRLTLELLRVSVELRTEILRLATEHREAPMIGYSHLQHAQPTTMGHYWLSWAAILGRDTHRALGLYDRANESPAGAAVLTGSPFAIDTHITSDLLGFDRPFENSRDAVWSPDAYLEALSCLTIYANTLARIAEDLVLWSTSEFGYVEIADGFCLNSSILPQKKNPISLEHIRGLAGVTAGRSVTALSVFRAPSDACVFDRYLVTEILWDTFADVTDAARLLSAILSSLHVNQQRMESTVRESWVFASDLASALVESTGASWRAAHSVVARLVRDLMDRGVEAWELTVEDVKAAAGDRIDGSEVDASTLLDALDPIASVRKRIVRGGPQPSEMLRQIKTFSSSLDSDAAEVRRRERRRQDAQRKLKESVDELVAETQI